MIVFLRESRSTVQNRPQNGSNEMYGDEIDPRFPPGTCR